MPVIIDVPVFPNIAATTIFYVHRCERFLPEILPIEATNLYFYGFLLRLFPCRKVQFSMFFHVSNLILTFQTD